MNSIVPSLIQLLVESTVKVRARSRLYHRCVEFRICADHPGVDAFGDACALNEFHCAYGGLVYSDPDDPDAVCTTEGAGGCTMTIKDACLCTCGTCVCESPNDRERTPGFGCRLPIA